MCSHNAANATKIPHDRQREEVLVWLAEHVPQSRIQHILRVEQMAAQLAQQHHLDSAKAAQAGLLHDLAKYFQPDRLLAIAQTAGLEIDPVNQANPHLLHAEVSAVVAKQFDVQDQAILQAISNHTLGRPDMDLLSCVVFLADSLEPGRGNSPELEAIRQVCQQDLHYAVWLVCDRTIKQLIETQRLIHPQMVLTRNWALEKSKAKLS